MTHKLKLLEFTVSGAVGFHSPADESATTVVPTLLATYCPQVVVSPRVAFRPEL